MKAIGQQERTEVTEEFLSVSLRRSLPFCLVPVSSEDSFSVPSVGSCSIAVVGCGPSRMEAGPGGSGECREDRTGGNGENREIPSGLLKSFSGSSVGPCSIAVVGCGPSRMEAGPGGSGECREDRTGGKGENRKLPSGLLKSFSGSSVGSCSIAVIGCGPSRREAGPGGSGECREDRTGGNGENREIPSGLLKSFSVPSVGSCSIPFLEQQDPTGLTEGFFSVPRQCSLTFW